MPRDGSPTRTRILDQAERLVLGQGFAATSVDEVIAAAGSSKGAFFHHFPTKADLGRALVERYAAADIDSLVTFMARAEEQADDPGEQLVAFVRLFEEAADDIVRENQSSCLYVSFIHDRQLHGDGSTGVIADAIVTWRDALRERIVASSRRRPLRGGLDPDALADHVFVTFEGAFILARSLHDPGHMRAQLRVLRQTLELVLGVGEAPAQRSARRGRSRTMAAGSKSTG